MLLRFIIRRNIIPALCIAVGLTIHYLVLTHAVHKDFSLQITQLKDQVLKSVARSNPISCNTGSDISQQSLDFILLENTIINGKPFDVLLMDLGIEDDNYLLEIAKSGIATPQDLQQEFISNLLPIILRDNLIPIKNSILSKWVKISRKDNDLNIEVDFLTQQISIQNFEQAVYIIDGLPNKMQRILQNWRKKVMDYIYVTTSLKEYRKN